MPGRDARSPRRPASTRPPRYSFFYNPYEDEEFDRCPRCGAATAERAVPLALDIVGGPLLLLNVNARLCAACDLLVAHQDVVQSLIVAACEQRDPSLIGSEYRVVGTVDDADWRHALAGSLTTEAAGERLHPFVDAVHFERAPLPEPTPPAGTPARSRGRPADAAGPAEAGGAAKPDDRANAPGAAGAGHVAADKRATVPTRLRPRYDEVVSQTDAICREHLTEEYAQLCRRMAAVLARKRPSPLERGRAASWACGIAYAIGSANFLFDKSQTPHLSAGELCALFGVSMATGSAKASEIRRLVKLSPFDVEWCLPSKLDDNPLAWLISVNGILVDARRAPREIQEEALRKGLIPYLPGRRLV